MTLTEQICKALRENLEGARANPPEAGQHLWRIFQRLSFQRSYHSAGPIPISYSDMDAFCRLMREPLEAEHVEVLIQMDWVFMEHAYSRKQAPEGVKILPPVSKAPISAELLDAMLG